MPHASPARGARRALAVLAALAVPAAAALAAAPATAATGTTPRPAASGTARTPLTGPGERVLRGRAGAPVGLVRSAATTAAAQRATRAYWTPARMRAAVPYTASSGSRPKPMHRPAAAGGPVLAAARLALPPLAVPPVTGRVDRPAGVGGAVSAAWRQRGGTVTGASWPQPSTATVARTTGKVFFTLDGFDWVCSGSAVASPDGETVLTAGHCVNSGGSGDPAGTYATNWVFVPGYETTSVAPYGEFPGVHLATTTGWRTVPDDFDDDVAFVDVATNDLGQTLSEAVGGLPVGFNRARGEWVTAIGYPADAPYDGRTLSYCRGYLVQDSYGGSPDQGLRCGMTAGSSGGPWVGALDPTTGAGTIVSVTSFMYNGLDGWLWGTYLGPTAKALYDAVAATTSA